jgi:hypothetical protein
MMGNLQRLLALLETQQVGQVVILKITMVEAVGETNLQLPVRLQLQGNLEPFLKN